MCPTRPAADARLTRRCRPGVTSGHRLGIGASLPPPVAPSRSSGKRRSLHLALALPAVAPHPRARVDAVLMTVARPRSSRAAPDHVPRTSTARGWRPSGAWTLIRLGRTTAAPDSAITGPCGGVASTRPESASLTSDRGADEPHASQVRQPTMETAGQAFNSCRGKAHYASWPGRSPRAC